MHFSAAEAALVNSILPDSDAFEAENATALFLKTGLHTRTLAQIWDISDEHTKGYLTRRDLAIALRLIGWAQLGRVVTPELANHEGPLAVLHDRPSPGGQSPIRVTSSSDALHPTPWTLQLQSLSPSNKAKYQSMYFEAGPHHGVLSGQKVWQLFSKSNLPPEPLSQIWKLVDTQNRGDLNAVEFIIALHLIHGLVEKHYSDIPYSIPTWLYEQAGGKPPRSPSPSNQLLNRAFTADFWTLKFHPEDKERIRALADNYFDILDEQRRGFIDGDAAVSFMNLSNLPLTELERIWDLADSDQYGQLDRDGFAHALLLIYRKLAGVESPPQALKRHVSTAPSIPTPRDEVQRLVHENRLLRSQSIILPVDTTKLLSEIGELRTMISNLTTENNSRVPQPSTSSKKDKSHGKKADVGHIQDAVFDELWNELQVKEATITALRSSLSQFEETTRQNEILQEQVDRLQQGLRTLKMDQDTVRQMVNEDLSREAEDLRRQVDELRQSTSQVPSSGGDEELQMLINEELSRENTALRSKVQELQESLEQLQRASVEQDGRRRTEEDLARRNRRLQRRIEEMTNQHARAEQELSERVAELQREISTLRDRSDTHDGHVPPPAYTETNETL